MSCLASEPRAPSAIKVYLPRSSMPRLKLVLGLAVAPHPHVAGRNADQSPSSPNSASVAAKPG